MFEEEVQRQERILAAVQAQGVAARDRAIVDLQEASALLTGILQEAAAAERQRRVVVEHIASQCGVCRTHLCLSKLLPFAPHPWQAHLSRLQSQIQQLLAATRAAAASNTQFLRRSLHAADNALGHVTQHRAQTKAAAYTHIGTYGARTAPQAAFVDSRG